MNSKEKTIDSIYLDPNSYFNFTNWMERKVSKLQPKYGKRKCIHCEKEVMNHYVNTVKTPNEYIPVCKEGMTLFPKNSNQVLTMELDLKKIKKNPVKKIKKKRTNKPSIYLPDDCLDILDKIMQKEKYKSYSQTIQSLIRNVKK